MAYTPIVVTQSTVNSGVFKNVYVLADSYKVTNSTVTAANNEIQSDKPSYNIYPIEITQTSRDFYGSSFDRFVNIQIDIACNAKDGWKKLDEMLDSLDNGFRTESDNLKTARLKYQGYTIVSIDPLESNGSQVFIKSVSLNFKILI
jgi:hypothetical protein